MKFCLKEKVKENWEKKTLIYVLFKFVPAATLLGQHTAKSSEMNPVPSVRIHGFSLWETGMPFPS